MKYDQALAQWLDDHPEAYRSKSGNIAPDGLSYDRRRTLKNQQILESGRHPATRVKLADNGQTCKSCKHLRVVGGHAKNYYKCGLVPITGGPGSDIRVSWPACKEWERDDG